MRAVTHPALDCARDGDIGEDWNTNGSISNPLAVNAPKKIVGKSDTAIRDIQLDLESFTFGLSELSMLVSEKSELGERIILLKKCVEDTKNKVDRLAK